MKAKRIIAGIVTLALCIGCGANVAAVDFSAYEKKTYQSPYYKSEDGMVGAGTQWTYEYSTDYGTDFTEMTSGSGTILYKSIYDTPAKLESPWNTEIYLTPGSDQGKSINAIQVFNVKEDGYITINACDITRHYGQAETGADALQDNEVAIYKNDSKIWPETDGWQTISAKSSESQPKANVCSQPSIENIEVKANDKIRFVVGIGNRGYYEWNDITKWNVKIDSYTRKSSVPSEDPGNAGNTGNNGAQNPDSNISSNEPVQIFYPDTDLSKYFKSTFKAPTYMSSDTTKGLGETWIYEYSKGYEAVFSAMDKGQDKICYQSPNQYASKLIAPWGTDLYLFPGILDNKSVNAVQTFVVPNDGFATINAVDVIRHYKSKDTGDDALQDSEIAIYLNETKIWPEGSDWKKVTASANESQPQQNICSVPELSKIKVKANDKIRFVVGCGNITYADWNDATQWYATVDLYTSQSGASQQGTVPATGDSKRVPLTSATIFSISAAAILAGIFYNKKYRTSMKNNY